MVKTPTKSFMYLLMSAVVIPHLTAPVVYCSYRQLVVGLIADGGSGRGENE